MQIPSFTEAVRLRPRLSDGSVAEPEYDEHLLEVCENVILDREIECTGDAVVVLQLVAEVMEFAPRSDGREIEAVRRVVEWLVRSSVHGEGGDLAARFV